MLCACSKHFVFLCQSTVHLCHNVKAFILLETFLSCHCHKLLLPRHLFQFRYIICIFSLMILLGSTWYNLLRGVLEVAGGLVVGILLGFLIQYFPSVDQVGMLLPHYHGFIIAYSSLHCLTAQLVYETT